MRGTQNVKGQPREVRYGSKDQGAHHHPRGWHNLHTCVIEGVKDDRDEQVIGELLELYELANK